ncbi:unnamed protein product [Rhizophagus irregularis]|nr:unnamed protein product [Rhizophagus irregularis]
MICDRCGKYLRFEWCKSCQKNNLKNNFANWTSGNEKIDNLIQEIQLKIFDRYDSIIEWIPYDQFNDIKELDKDECSIIYSAIWKDGPLEYDENKYDYSRNQNTRINLKCLHNSQNITDEFLNEVKTCDDLYGISQNSDTKDYILVLRNKYCNKCGECFINKYNIWCKSCQINDLEKNFINWTSGNEKINNSIQEMQLEINYYYDTIVEWIPYDQFNDIKELGKDEFATIYSAIWKDGPLQYDENKYEYIRRQGTKVNLKLYNTQNITSEFLNKVKPYFENDHLYGISQNSDKDYMIILQDIYCDKCVSKYLDTYYKWCKPCQINNLKNNFTNWTSENEKIDNLIQEMQLEINNSDNMVEWITYNQFNYIKELGKDEFATIYSAIWKDGPLKYDKKEHEYSRKQRTKVNLKLYNSQNITDVFLNECNKKFTAEYYEWCKPCQINDLEKNWTSGNEKIDNLIQEKQLKINEKYDIIVEWIPYNQFNNIKELGKDEFATIYSAIWKDGPLQHDLDKHEYSRNKSIKVNLKLYKSQNITTDEFLNEVNSNEHEIYGISQNSNTRDFIIVFPNKYYCEKCKRFADNTYKWCKLCQINSLSRKSSMNWTSEYEIINNLIQEMQSKINSFNDIVFEWVPYNKFTNIKEIGEGGFAKVYLAIWKDGPLQYNTIKHKYTRNQDKKVALKCLYNSQYITSEFLNEVKSYSIEEENGILKIYGISQNPDTKEYIMILDYAKGGNLNNLINKNYRNLSWPNKISMLLNISTGLKEIHQKKMVHRDFHTGNILSNIAV